MQILNAGDFLTGRKMMREIIFATLCLLFGVSAVLGFAVLAFCFAVFISQEEVVIGGKAYIGEYESFTGMSKTLVTCYEKRNSVFTEAEYSFILDYGIVLGDKPDFNDTPYEIIANEEP